MKLNKKVVYGVIAFLLVVLVFTWNWNESKKAKKMTMSYY